MRHSFHPLQGDFHAAIRRASLESFFFLCTTQRNNYASVHPMKYPVLPFSPLSIKSKRYLSPPLIFGPTLHCKRRQTDRQKHVDVGQTVRQIAASWSSALLRVTRSINKPADSHRKWDANAHENAISHRITIRITVIIASAWHGPVEADFILLRFWDEKQNHKKSWESGSSYPWKCNEKWVERGEVEWSMRRHLDGKGAGEGSEAFDFDLKERNLLITDWLIVMNYCNLALLLSSWHRVRFCGWYNSKVCWSNVRVWMNSTLAVCDQLVVT